MTFRTFINIAFVIAIACLIWCFAILCAVVAHDLLHRFTQ